MLPDAAHPLVFFTGGTALRGLSGYLAARTRDTVHIVTPFDSGGSTAVLRSTFAMPAVGDMRNRLEVLADPDLVPAPVLALWKERLPAEGDPDELRSRLTGLAHEDNPVWAGMPRLARATLLSCLKAFLRNMPRTFDARNASLGNIFMAGCYLAQERRLTSVLGVFSRLLRARGTVCPVVEENLHLAAGLADGTVIVGQHLFKDITSPVASLFLTVHEPRPGVRARTACRPLAAAAALAHLRRASLVCYPMGSFYTSVLANLLPAGVGAAVARAECPKVFLPNTGHDAELVGRTLYEQVSVLLDTLGADCPGQPAARFLTHVALDTVRGRYGVDREDFARWLAERGVTLVEAPLVEEGGVSHDAAATGTLLLSMCGRGPHAG